MFSKIARINTNDNWAVEIGYEIPNVITANTKLEPVTQIVRLDGGEIDVESTEYKEAESVAEVLKIGFQIGCSYTIKVIEKSTKMGDELMTEPSPDEHKQDIIVE